MFCIKRVYNYNKNIMDYKYEDVPLMDFVKALTIYRGLTLRKLLKKLHEEKNYSNSYAGFYNKLKNCTIKFSEINDIAKTLGYEIVFRDAKNLKEIRLEHDAKTVLGRNHLL